MFNTYSIRITVYAPHTVYSGTSDSGLSQIRTQYTGTLGALATFVGMVRTSKLFLH